MVCDYWGEWGGEVQSRQRQLERKFRYRFILEGGIFPNTSLAALYSGQCQALLLASGESCGYKYFLE